MDSYQKELVQFRNEEYRLQKLELSYNKLREDLDLLHSILEDKCIVCAATMDIQIHKKRWTSVKQLSGWASNAKLLDVMVMPGLACKIIQQSGSATLGRCHTVSRLVHGLVETVSLKSYACGGIGDAGLEIKSVERFDPQKGTWESLPALEMHLSRINSTAAVLDGHLYICGTVGELGMSVHRLDRDMMKWVSVASMPTTRSFFGAAAIGKYLYVCGGLENCRSVHGPIHSLRAVDRFIETGGAFGGRWESVQPMIEVRYDHSVVAISGLLFVCGGSDAHTTKSSVECYCPHDGRREVIPWSPRSSMFEARRGFAAAASRNLVLVCGGQDAHFNALASTECYNLESGAWEVMAPMQTPRHHHAAASVANNVFVCGGHEHSGLWTTHVTPSVVDLHEQFDLALGMWRTLPPMKTKRGSHVMVTAALEGLKD